MFKRTEFNRRKERGSCLAGAFLVSMALAVSMMALLSYTKTANHQAESLLSKNLLRRIAQEKFTNDILALNKNVELKSFDTNPASFPRGEAQSFIQPVPASLKQYALGNYLVVVATITNENAPAPHHIRLESIIEFTSPATAPINPPSQKTVPLPDYVDEQLKSVLSPDDPQFEEAKQKIMDMLKEQLGSDNLDSFEVPVQAAQYRDQSLVKNSTASEEEKKDAFFMSPVSVDSPKSNIHVRVWKETYY